MLVSLFVDHQIVCLLLTVVVLVMCYSNFDLSSLWSYTSRVLNTVNRNVIWVVYTGLVLWLHLSCSLRGHMSTVPNIEAHSPCHKRCRPCPHWPCPPLTILSSLPSYPFPSTQQRDPSPRRVGHSRASPSPPKAFNTYLEPALVNLSLHSHVKTLHPHPPQSSSLQFFTPFPCLISPRRQCPK